MPTEIERLKVENESLRQELERFKASAYRHFFQLMEGEVSEAHHVAVAFNLAGIQYLMNKLGVNINGDKIDENS